MNDILSSQYGLSFHPFSSDIPVEAMTTGKQIEWVQIGPCHAASGSGVGVDV
jgi:hypothetical protein